MAPKIVACVEDVDEETGFVIQGSNKYAQSLAPGSPSKEKANSGKSRKDRMTRPISTSPQYGQTDSDDTIHPAVPDKKARDKARRHEQRVVDRAAEKALQRANERAAEKAAAREQQARQEDREERHRIKKEKEKAVRREQELRDQEQRERDDRQQQRDRSAPKKSAIRPSTKHVNTAPVVHTQKTAQKPDEYRRPKFSEEEASQYGVQQPGKAQGSRPRASSRPASYYGQGSRPPTSNKQWHAANNASPFTPAAASPFAPSIHAPPSSHASSPFTPAPMPIPIHPSPHVQSPFAPAPGSSYGAPPGAWGPGSVPYPMQAPHHPPPPPSNDYFPPTPVASSPRHSNLAHRFQQRPSSAMGHRSMSASSFEYDNYGYHPSPGHGHGPGPTYEQENIPIPIGRRPSLKVRERDSDLMPPPPPPRSRTTAPQQGFRPPPQPHPQQRQIMSQGYDSDDFDGEEFMYQDIVPHGYQYDDGVVARPRGHRRGSSTYSHRAYQIEPAPAPAPAPTRSSRRHSYMAGGESGSYSQMKYDSAQAAAMAYQNGVSGGGVPLTAAALSKAGKKSKSSRSSGSSDSLDESDFLRSATTRTTRSSAIDGDDITIKVTGHAVLRVGNAEIQCQDGGEINISQAARIAGGSDRDTVYSDERRSRMDRPALRDRSESQADSYSRSQAGDYEQFRIPFT